MNRFTNCRTLLIALLAIGFLVPGHVAVASNLLVSDYNSGNIYKFTSSGTQSTFASGPAAAYDLAFDSSGNLFEANYYGAVYKFTPNGTQSTFASGFTVLGGGLAFNSGGNLFVTDFGSDSILKFTPNGTQSTFARGLNGPSYLAFDSNGNLFEGDYLSGKIYEFTLERDQIHVRQRFGRAGGAGI